MFSSRNHLKRKIKSLVMAQTIGLHSQQPLARPYETIWTSMETQKATGVVFFPPLLPQQQLPAVGWKNFAPFSCRHLQGFVAIYSAECFTQSCVTKPGSDPNPCIYILILCPAIRHTLRIRQAFREYCAVQPPDSCCHSKSHSFICLDLNSNE